MAQIINSVGMNVNCTPGHAGVSMTVKEDTRGRGPQPSQTQFTLDTLRPVSFIETKVDRAPS